MLKEILNTYRQDIWQPKLQQIDFEGHIRTCGGGNFEIMPIFAIQFLQNLMSHMRHILLKNSNLPWIKDTSK